MKKKIISLGAFSLATMTALTTISFATKKDSSDNDEMIYYGGRIFNNPEEALAFLVQDQKIATGQQKVFGDISRSFINAETGQLNKNFLPDYDVSKTHLAWFNAGHGITKNYEDARNSYFNPGTIVSRFIDGFTDKTFATESAARNSINNRRLNTQLGFYDVDFIDKTGQVVQRKINPFSKIDVDSYKKNLAENIDFILKDNMANEQSQTKLGYEITFNDENDYKSKNASSYFDFNQETKNKWIDEYINQNRNNGFSIYRDGNNIYQAKNDSYSDYYESSDFTSGSWKHNSSTTFDVLHGKLSYTIYENDNSLRWSAGDLSNLNASDMEKILKGSGDKGGHYQPQSVSNVLSKINSDRTYSPTINSRISDFIRDKINDSSNDISNSVILNQMVKKAANNFNLNNSSTSLSYSTSKSDLPYFETGFGKHGPFGRDHHMWIKKGFHTFEYTKKYKTDLASTLKFNLGSDIKNKKLFNALWNIAKYENKSRNITISKNGLKLFRGNISINKDNGKFGFKNNLEIDKANYQGLLNKDIAGENWRNEFETTDPENLDLGSNANKQGAFLEYLLGEFKKELNEVKKYNSLSTTTTSSKKSYKEVFDKYFRPTKINDKGGIYTIVNTFPDGSEGKMAYNGDLRNGKIATIEPHEIFRKFLSQIYDAYKKYKEEYIFLQIADKIPDVNEVLFYQNTISSRTNINQTLAEYIVNNIGDFNPSLSSGIFASAGSIANTVEERDSLSRQKVNPDLILIAYDNNGNQINSGDYKYDSSDLLEYNSRLNITPERDYDHIFIDGYNGAIANEVHNIYWVSFNNHKLYFDKFVNLKLFMLKYIKENSSKI